MAGSIRPRPEKGADAFELRVYLGRDADGKVRHRTRVFHGTRRQAERELARMVVVQEQAPAVLATRDDRAWGARTTINDAISGWKENGWNDLSPSTTRRYASIWATHIREEIGRRVIASLSPYDVELYLRGLKNKGLSEASVRHTRAILHRSCRLARKWSGNALPNPVADTELPEWKLVERAHEVRAPSAEEVRRLIRTARGLDRRLAAFVRLVAATGIRRGEACAVRWGDLDLESCTARVDESIVAVEGGVSVKGPKSRAGIRTLAIDTGTAEEIRAWRDEVAKLARAIDEELAADHFVFAADLPATSPPHPDSFTHAFGKLRVLAGVAADVHLHSLRHFQATVLDPVISEAQKQSRLGWSTVHMARHYTDRIGDEDRRGADHVGALLDDA